MKEIMEIVPDWVVTLTIMIYCFNFVIINIIKLCTYHYHQENIKYFIDLLIPFRRVVLDSIAESKKKKVKNN
jgi:hypothetical protein